MRAIDIDTLEWFQIKCVGLDEPMILIRKPHILELDIIDAEPVRHGRWEEVIERSIFGKRFLRCSNCKSEQWLMIRFNYCPNCGAKMDEKED